MSKPRVLFVARTRYRLPLDSGQSLKWEALGEQLDLRVLATSAGGGTDARFTLLPDLPPPAFYALLPLAVARAAARFRPDVIVAQSPYEAYCVALARPRAKLLLEVHGDWATATRFYGSRARRVLEPVSTRVARAAIRRADAVRTVSPFTSELVRRVGVEPVATFTTFFDTTAFTHSPPVPLPAAPAALFVGVLERYKNVAGLETAWRAVAERVPGATLTVVGRGHEADVVRRLSADLPGAVAWRERISPQEVADALDASAVLVLPSFSEGLPRVAMEAFARGRPVVGARAGGIPDIVEDGVSGILVDPRDSSSIAEGIVRALSDRALLERLAAGAAASAARWIQPPEAYAARMREVVDGLR